MGLGDLGPSACSVSCSWESLNGDEISLESSWNPNSLQLVALSWDLGEPLFGDWGVWGPLIQSKKKFRN